VILSDVLSRDDPENRRIVLGLLQSVERDGVQSQRKLAGELGVALGLVNAYLKCCVKKGLLKVSRAPARRYAYYLTPQGFNEKSRLTAEYLSHAFDFFRRARHDCSTVFEVAKARGWTRVALLGLSDLTEIAVICAPESGITIVAIVDSEGAGECRLGLPVVGTLAERRSDFDGVVVTGVAHALDLHSAALAEVGADLVLAPALLGVPRVVDTRAA
jgi:DNA-binding MarR family transcriptional regulator